LIDLVMESEPRFFKFHHLAMATEFQVVIAEDEGVDEAYAASAAHAVFAEIDRLEEELSRFLPMSDIARIQQLKAGDRTPVGLAAMDCLQLAALVQEETAGAFDISVGPLMSIFRNQDGSPRTPQEGEIEEARKRIGAKVYQVDEEGFVMALVDYPALDLGAIGKGYALDQAAALLLEWQVKRVLLNAGDSTVLAMQPPPGRAGWPVSVGNEERMVLELCERAVSGSGFQVKGGHIMNPRTLEPLPVKEERVWALAPTAALSDAMSTAFAVMGVEEIKALCGRVSEIEAIGV
jgi:thiamine biosynthesis lipoprotein